MTEKTRKRRSAPLSWRPPEALEEEFLVYARNQGLSKNALITMSVTAFLAGGRTRGRFHTSAQKRLLATMLARFGRLSDILHDTALSAGPESGISLLIESARGELAVIRSALMKLMGRKP